MVLALQDAGPLDAFGPGLCGVSAPHHARRPTGRGGGDRRFSFVVDGSARLAILRGTGKASREPIRRFSATRSRIPTRRSGAETVIEVSIMSTRSNIFRQALLSKLKEPIKRLRRRMGLAESVRVRLAEHRERKRPKSRTARGRPAPEVSGLR